MKFFITICLFVVCNFVHAQTDNDSIAIVKLLEKAATTFRAGDAKAYADCWHVQPYSIILISTPDGKSMSIPAETLGKPSSAMGRRLCNGCKI